MPKTATGEIKSKIAKAKSRADTLKSQVELIVGPFMLPLILSVAIIGGWSYLMRERIWPFHGRFDPTLQDKVKSPSSDKADKEEGDKYGNRPNTDKFDYSQFGDGFAPLNALFSGIAAILVSLSVYWQVKSLEGTRKSVKLQAAAIRAQLRTSRHEALMNANRHFHSPAFELSRTRAMVTIRACIKDEKFCKDFLNGYSVATDGYAPMWSKDKQFQERLRRCSGYDRTFEDQLFHCSDGWMPRHVVTEVLNFYLALNHLNLSKEILKSNSFYYEFWRPKLWFFVDNLEDPNSIAQVDAGYAIGVQNKVYSAALQKLDACFGLEPLGHVNERAAFFFRHPWIRQYSISPERRYPQTDLTRKYIEM